MEFIIYLGTSGNGAGITTEPIWQVTRLILKVYLKGMQEWSGEEDGITLIIFVECFLGFLMALQLHVVIVLDFELLDPVNETGCA